MEKININNHHLLPLRRMNLNLQTMKMEDRTKEQHFTRCLNIDNIDDVNDNDEYFKKLIISLMIYVLTINQKKIIYKKY
jgi:hypothetical protein